MNAAVENPYWMPFTANRDFNKQPRVISGPQDIGTQPMTVPACMTRSPAFGRPVSAIAIRRSSRPCSSRLRSSITAWVSR